MEQSARKAHLTAIELYFNEISLCRQASDRYAARERMREFLLLCRESQRKGFRGVLIPRTRAVICVHLAGWPCDMDAIMALAAERGLLVIEDCAQAHGARWRGRPVGAIGHVGAWSFCQDKIMTTGGEGGMVTTDDRELWARMWSLKDHGKSWEAVYERQHPSGFRWLHEGFGTNWRLTGMQAAIGRIQLRRMDEWHARRLGNTEAIWRACRGVPGLRVPVIPPEVGHAAYPYNGTYEHAYHML
jgi:dTDP-4-amino-4,6-dideoxygalactose transaminase